MIEVGDLVDFIEEDEWEEDDPGLVLRVNKDEVEVKWLTRNGVIDWYPRDRVYIISSIFRGIPCEDKE